VVIHESRGPLYEEYELTITSWIKKLIKEEINSEIIPIDFIDLKMLFEPKGLKSDRPST
jgi:hypothetical protein